MNGIFSRMKDSLWRTLNAPDTELVDEHDDDEWYEEEEHDWELQTDRAREYHEPVRRKDRRTETSARHAQNHKVLEMYGKATGNYGGPEVIVRHPVDVNEAAKICDFIREGKMGVVDLTGMERPMAQRIADFLGGACYAINGCIERISKDIFIIVPDGIRISGDVKDELEKDGYSIPKTHSR